MPFRGGLRGAPRGHGRGGFRGGSFRGGFRGGGLAQAGGGRDFSNQELYADYNGPDQPSAFGGSGGYGGGSGGSGGYNSATYTEGQPSQQIMVRNVGVVELCVMSFCDGLSFFDSCLGQPQMRIWLNSLRLQVKWNLQRFCLTVLALKDVVSSNLGRPVKRRLLSVRYICVSDAKP